MSSFPIKIDLNNINNLIILSMGISGPQLLFLFFYQNGLFKPFQFSDIVNFMIGTEANNFSNLHSIILILSLMIIVGVCQKAGVFQYIAIKLVKRSKGNPNTLFLYCCLLGLFVTAIINVVVAVFLLIPLIIMICRILHINPIPFILSETVLIKIGSIMFLISAIPNILIGQVSELHFFEYMVNITWFALILAVTSIIFLKVYFKKELKAQRAKLVQTLVEYNPWNYVPSRKLFYKSIICLILTYIFIALLPDYMDITTLTISIILIILSGLKADEIIKNIDFEFILYLLGVFIITGCLLYVGVIDSIGYALKSVSGGSLMGSLQIFLWSSALISGPIDNVPITIALLPIVPILTFGLNSATAQIFYVTLCIGVNLGDNFMPLGDNMLVMKISETNSSPIRYMEFQKLGLIITTIQIAITSLYAAIMLTIVV